MSFKFEDLVKISHLIHQKIYLNQHEYTLNNALSIVLREIHIFYEYSRQRLYSTLFGGWPQKCQ